jgi:hypothetical protein
MATVQISGHVYALQFAWEKEPTFLVMSHDGMVDAEYTYVGPVDIAYTMPEGWNPTAAKLAALAAKREAICKAFADSVREIDTQISKLQAIEYTAEVVL